jgi:RNA polymerase sigma factor (sigma-70 family)
VTAPPGDFLVTVGVKNARLLRAMRAAGYFTAAELARASHVDQSCIGAYLNLKRAPYLANGNLSGSAQKLCAALHSVVENLFPPSFLHQALERNQVVVEMTEEQVRNVMIAADPGPERNLLIAEGLAAIHKSLAQLTTREQRILRWRFGFDEPALTLDECGRREGVTREHIRQVELRALQRLQHPVRCRRLKAVYDALGEEGLGR